MSSINEAEKYWAAKEQEKKRQEAVRNAAILRELNAESIKYNDAMLKLSASRITLFIAIAANCFLAARGWGIM